MSNIAVLMTCFNRRDTTMRCLRSIFDQHSIATFNVHCILVDDGSSDGTSAAVRQGFPEVTIIPEAGSKFWCGGMRIAFGKALREGFDYYLWVNDDVTFYSGFLQRLISGAQIAFDRDGQWGIIVGSCKDPLTGLVSYGGFRSQKRFLGLKTISPGDDLLRCDTFNGNCVLIPSDVAGRVGNLSSGFSHSLGDIDYGLRAKKLGISSWVVPGFVGECEPNPAKGRWASSDLSIVQRWTAMKAAKGLPPAEYSVFVKEHAGIMWWYYLLKTYIRVIFPSLWK